MKIFLFFLLIPISVFGETSKYQIQESAIHFLAIGNPSAIKIHGKSLTAKGLIEKNVTLSGTITTDLNQADTGISLRNKHMKEKYIEVQKYPEATLFFENLSVSATEFSATLTLHGVKKHISGRVQLKEDKQKISGNLEFPIKLSEFQIAIPSFAGITVAEEVIITASFDAVLL